MALLLCLVLSACSLGGGSEPPALSGIPTSSSGMQAGTPVLNGTPTAGGTLLPGQQIWKQGVSSFLFGTNDTQEWSDNNVETNPAIQQALKEAHFTLMRTFFFDKSLADGHATTDAEIEQRIKTVENSGMVCLGVLESITNVAFDEHVVRYLGSRCNLYEFGNEPDYYGATIEDYLTQWNTVIPLLRQINPQAKFIGPVTYNDSGNQCHHDPGHTHCFMQDFLTGVKASHVLPDAISFHWYPCYNDSEAYCLAQASTYAEVTAEVKGWVKSILGEDLPVGITEWNYDSGVPPPQYSSTFIQQFTTTALRSMIQAKLDFADQFDALSYSGYGGQDMFELDRQGQPKAQYYAIKTIINEYRP
jgi:hypothetical protein